MYQTLPIDPLTPFPDVETPGASPQTLWGCCQPSIQTQGYPVIMKNIFPLLIVIKIPATDTYQLRDWSLFALKLLWLAL